MVEVRKIRCFALRHPCRAALCLGVMRRFVVRDAGTLTCID